MPATQHIALKGIAMLADRTLMRLELQVVALDVLRESVAPLEDPITDVALVATLRCVGNAMLLETRQRTERLLANGAAVGRSPLDLCLASDSTATLSETFRLWPLSQSALEFVTSIDAPMCKADVAAVTALVALQPSIAQRQRLADVAHVLTQSKSSAKKSQAAKTLDGKRAWRRQRKVPLTLAMPQQLLHCGKSTCALVTTQAV